MVFYDQTEVSNSSTWLDLFNSMGAQPLKGLEKHTGADVLIAKGPVAPAKRAILDAAATGILIQRKENQDMLQSIPKLSAILQRMMACDSIPYLAVVGEFKPVLGDVVCNGRGSGWTYASFLGALNAWQLRGGNVMMLPSPEEAASWYESLNHLVVDGKLSKSHYVTSHPQKIAGGIYDEKRDLSNVLMAFDSLGPVRGSEVAKHFGTLSEALMWLSYPEGPTIQGIGPGTHKKIRNQMGLAEGQRLIIDRIEE